VVGYYNNIEDNNTVIIELIKKGQDITIIAAAAM
jgi:hypothetical protein